MIDLKKLPTGPDPDLKKKHTEKETEQLKEEIFTLQDKLYAERKHGVLIVLQGMDTAGKDGTIHHVFSCVNPMGCTVRSFKTPTAEEASHDFLWRVHPHVPAKGMIGIFNRSHYEDILFPSVHKTFEKKVLERRYDAINHFEEYLVDNGIVLLKFFLHISEEEQKKRIRERLHDSNKHWKYSASDSKEENYWSDYMGVYERIIGQCSPEIPWLIVPADHRWYRNYFIAKEIAKTLKKLKSKYPS